jgi:MOSC domain-containing protein YiiM
MIVQVAASQGGVPKTALSSATVTESGIIGDAWRHPFHGSRRKAILLITLEGIDEINANGFALFPGALGENLTTRGLDRLGMHLGQRFRAGEAAIELTQIRTPCSTLDAYGSRIQAAIYDERVMAGDRTSPRWGLSGFYAQVLEPGLIRPGDRIALD